MSEIEPRDKPEPPPRLLVRSPHAIVRWVGDVLEIATPDSDRNVETTGTLVLRLLGHFTKPALAADVVARFPKADPAELHQAIAQLVGAGILVEHVEATRAEPIAHPEPLTVPAALPIGQRCHVEMLVQKSVAGGLAIVGAPSDLGAAGEVSPRQGPRLIRKHFTAAPAFFPPAAAGSFSDVLPTLTPAQLLDLDGRRSYQVGALPVLDLGDVALRLGEGLSSFGERLSQVVRGILDGDMVPIVLGGDHSITWYVISVLAQRHQEFGLLHFDAHTDLYDSRYPDRLTYANVMVQVLGLKSLRRLHQIGLRGYETVSTKQQLIVDPRISYVSSREARRRTPEQVFEGLPRDIPYYLSFDIDCITPQLAAETGTPMIGGLEYYDALELIDYAGRNFRLIGADFTEVALHPGQGDWAARVAASFLTELMLTFMKPQPLTSHWQIGLAGK